MTRTGIARVALSVVLLTAGLVVGQVAPAGASVTLNANRAGAARARPAISVGNAHACALAADASVKCWGYNASGQLGNGTTTNSSTAVSVASNPAVFSPRAIAAGLDHTCALMANGTVQCWGTNADGQLGNGSFTDSSTPVAVSGLTRVVAISSGGHASCALTSDGIAKCWGANSVGQLGNGTLRRSPVPVVVAGLTTAVAIATADGHSCALLVNGTVRCWGYNSNGQLGNGTTKNSATPILVKNLTGAITITANGLHSCALLVDGTARCWGYNSSGQLGNGTAKNSATPVVVKGLSSAVAIAAGADHTCALMAGAAVKCWGYNGYGQLGTGTTKNSSIPVYVLGVTDAVGLAAGGHDSCVVTADGTTECWGANGVGQLGNGTVTNSGRPVAVSGLSTAGGAVALATGGAHSCALLGDGSVNCWGDNSSGQLGNGSVIDSLTPFGVQNLADVTAISVGAAHSCALLLNGSVACWGDNGDGQLGDGNNDDSSTPVAVEGIGGSSRLGSIKAISAAGDHTCALAAAGTVTCWGDNTEGELGNNTTNSSFTPVPVKSIGGNSRLTNVRAISTAGDHSCALLVNGIVDCWGYNNLGQLGDGTNIGPQHCQQLGVACSKTPVHVDGPGGVGVLSGVVAVTTGDKHSCALTLPQGTVRCWGSNATGQLGNNSSNNAAPTPVSVRGVNGAGILSEVTAISGGDLHSCASLSDGTAVCWGYDAFGQLGVGTNTGPQSCFATQFHTFVPCSKTPVRVESVDGGGAFERRDRRDDGSGLLLRAGMGRHHHVLGQ